jgi:hypothetical protein
MRNLDPKLITQVEQRRNYFGLSELGWRCNTGNSPVHKEEGHIVAAPVEARAGFLDRPILVVLIVSTTLVIGLFALLYIGFFSR